MRTRRRALTSNLDSLLDTMTNVAGILVMLVAVTQISVREKIRFVISGGPTETGLTVAERREMRALLNKLHQRWGPPQSTELEVAAGTKAARKLLATLRREVAHPLDLRGTRQSLAADLTAVDAEIAALKGKIRAAAERLEQLKAQLDEVVAQHPERIELRVPDPKPAPAGTKAAMFACRGGRVYPMDIAALDKISEAAVGTVVNQPPPISNMDINSRDMALVEEHFGKHDIGDKFFRLLARTLRDERGRCYDLRREYQPRANRGGYTIREIREPGSAFRAHVRGLNPKGRWARFFVYGDSFVVYLEARKIAEARAEGGKRTGLLAGWTPYALEEALSTSFLGGGGGGRPVGPD
jgi:hypothetical protein